MDFSGAEDMQHEWTQIRDQCFEAQGDLDTLNLFRELESEFPVKKYIAAKKYGSLWELQDRALSKKDKKKRERTPSRKNLQDSELSGRSLSDSDLRGKWEQAKKEARRTLELGKKLD
ncbi:hypothetical protein V6N12_002917 [Hibiscus sabdariffa]|uniref:Uncharacterized protein n=1 Tax=Hibiscus sabdariffa TaxID=183260 RepID=A0ABR2EAD0_9ROSI